MSEILNWADDGKGGHILDRKSRVMFIFPTWSRVLAERQGAREAFVVSGFEAIGGEYAELHFDSKAVLRFQIPQTPILHKYDRIVIEDMDMTPDDLRAVLSRLEEHAYSRLFCTFSDDDRMIVLARDNQGKIDEAIKQLCRVDISLCPFCGGAGRLFNGEPRATGHGETENDAGVQCEECPASITLPGHGHIGSRQASAVQQWNYRWLN